MKIAVDLDNTLADTTGVLSTLLTFKHGTKITKAFMTEWDWPKRVSEESFWAIYNMMDSPEHGGINLRRALPPVDPLAAGIVKTLIKGGHEVHILTANRPEAKDSIEAWLFGHGLEPHVELVGRVSGKEKVEMDYDLFIDDSPNLIEPMRQWGNGSKLLVLLSQPWNSKEDVSQDRNIIRAQNWRHIQAILEERGIL